MKAISTNPQTLHIKRTSLWNKANEELKKHQLLVERVKEKREDFYNEPYGDPFASEEMRCARSQKQLSFFVCFFTNSKFLNQQKRHLESFVTLYSSVL